MHDAKLIHTVPFLNCPRTRLCPTEAGTFRSTPCLRLDPKLALSHCSTFKSAGWTALVETQCPWLAWKTQETQYTCLCPLPSYNFISGNGECFKFMSWKASQNLKYCYSGSAISTVTDLCENRVFDSGNSHSVSACSHSKISASHSVPTALSAQSQPPDCQSTHWHQCQPQ